MPVIQHAVENAMDTCPNRCSIFSMWKFLGALLVVATPAFAQENATAYEALRVVGSELGRGALNHVVSINGVKGDPQPKKWKIILEDPDGRGVREVEVAVGNLDSSGAYEVASHTADLSHANFATVDYTLRTDERGEPVWIITLLTRSSRPVGTIHIGAMRGTVKRTEGMFAGATMEDVENDYDTDEEHGPFSSVKRRIKDTFRRTQEEARGMFDRVKRSFSDFINRG